MPDGRTYGKRFETPAAKSIDQSKMGSEVWGKGQFFAHQIRDDDPNKFDHEKYKRENNLDRNLCQEIENLPRNKESLIEVYEMFPRYNVTHPLTMCNYMEYAQGVYSGLNRGCKPMDYVEPEKPLHE